MGVGVGPGSAQKIEKLPHIGDGESLCNSREKVV